MTIFETVTAPTKTIASGLPQNDAFDCGCFEDDTLLQVRSFGRVIVVYRSPTDSICLWVPLHLLSWARETCEPTR